MTKDFYDWLHFNDGERYEGLHEEFLEGGGEPGGFLEWAEAKYAAESKTGNRINRLDENVMKDPLPPKIDVIKERIEFEATEHGSNLTRVQGFEFEGYRYADPNVENRWVGWPERVNEFETPE